MNYGEMTVIAAGLLPPSCLLSRPQPGMEGHGPGHYRARGVMIGVRPW